MQTPESSESASASDIAIVGLACRFPGAQDLDTFWKNLIQGRESIVALGDEELEPSSIDPVDHAHPNYVKVAAAIDGADMFDAELFGYSANEARLMDPQHRIFLECAWEALEHAAYDPQRYAGRIGVFAGARTNTYLFNIYTQPDLVRSVGAFELGLGNDLAFLATRVSHKLDLRGPSYAVQTACSTSLVAVHLACQSLLLHECDMALAGAVSLQVPQRTGYLHRQDGFLSPDGHCRVFDANARGTLFGNGAGVVLVKRLADALADGDVIHAVIKGSATNNDGSNKASFTGPSVRGQAEVIIDALANANVAPDTISYVEAHGTGTRIGDPIEVRALTEAFRTGTDASGYCTIGSVKSNVGHLDTAAGIAGLTKVTLALQNRMLPPTVHFETPNPQIVFEETPFRVNATPQPWTSSGGPRRAGISAFGAGGTNAHVILEEAPERPPSIDDRGWHVVLASARTQTALDQGWTRLTEFLQTHPDVALADVAYTTQIGRRAFDVRRAVVASSPAEAAARMHASDGSAVIAGRAQNTEASVALVLPGLDAERVSSGHQLYRASATYRRHIDRCADVLRAQAGFDLRQALEDLAAADGARGRGESARPRAVWFAVEYALAELVASLGLAPAAMAGHGVGEYVAACRAGVFSLEDALRLVVLGDTLLASLPPGTMATPELSAALEREVARIGPRAPQVPFLSAATGTWVGAETATDPRHWARQLRDGAQWRRALVELAREKGRLILEAGPASDATGLGADEDGQPRFNGVRLLPRSSADEPAMAQVLAAIARAWTRGARVDWTALHESPRRRVALPTYAFDRRRYWVDAAKTALASDEPTRPAGKRTDIAEWFHAPAWKRVALEQPAADERHAWMILADETGLAAIVARHLRAAGHDVTMVITRSRYEQIDESCYAIRRDDPEHYHQVLADLRAAGRLPDRVAHFLTITDWPSGPAMFQAAQEDGFLSILSLAQAFATLGTEAPVALTAITSGAYDVAGDGVRPEAATASALLKVIPQEAATISCRQVDVAAADFTKSSLREALGSRLAAELMGGTERCVAYRSTTRWVGRLEPVRLADNAATLRPLREKGVYLITGGLGAVGLMLAKYLARAVHARLVLVGRSPCPPRETWATRLTAADASPEDRQRLQKLLEIEALGGEVMVQQADVAVKEDMLRVVGAATRRFGALHGVLHAAGVTHGSSLYRSFLEIDKREAEVQFRPKVLGSYVLEHVLAGHKLDFIVLFSSASSVLGGLGLAAYAAANAFLDAFAISRSRAGLPVVSANWDPWPAETRQYKGMTTQIDQYSMTEEEAGEAFRRVACVAPEGQVAVITGDFDNRYAVWVERTAATAARGGMSARPELDTPYEPPRNELEKALAGLMADLLGLECVGIHDGFFDVGGHSLLATRLISDLRQQLHVEVPIDRFFETPTVAGLAQLIGDTDAADEPERADILATLDELSNSEIESHSS